jgi:uncharacterized protein (TIGR02271 family)
MKNKMQIKIERAAREAAIQDKTSDSRFPGFLTNPRWTLAIASVATLALAGGCCTKREGQAYYSPAPAAAYAGPAPEQRAEGEMVVPLRQESVSVGKREVDGGSVRLKKIVKTETINQPIELRHEEIVIDRQPGTGEAASNKRLAQPFQEEETVIPLKREEAVVERQVTPAGHIVVRTRSAGTQTNIQTQVRREDVEIGQPTYAQNVTINPNVRSSASTTAAATTTTTAVGGAETPSSQTSGTAASSSEQSEFITDPATLPIGNATTFIGRRVQFRDMKVRTVEGDRFVIVSANNESRPLYAVCKEQSSALQPGDTVMITGTIRQKLVSPTETGPEVKGAQRLLSQPYYIEVEKIETAPK